MQHDNVLFIIFLIFTSAAVVSTFVLWTRQSLLVAYILIGVFLGPWGLNWIPDPSLAKQVGDVGIIFLLFLLGLHLQPQNLLHMLKKVTWVALISSVVFAGLGYYVSLLFGFNQIDSLVIAATMMFSSTIIGLKLLPTTILHHQHVGEVMISVLLMQDFIAIAALMALQGAKGGYSWMDVGIAVLAFPGILLFAFLAERYVLVKLLAKFDRTKEYVFLLSIGWCLGMAELAKVAGLSDEIGAFIAGVTLAASPISLYIAESLKPLRDFFLVMFFFSIGASFDFQYMNAIWIPTIVLSVIALLIKPLTFYALLRRTGENKAVSKEVSIRLGQGSEFSLLVVALATEATLITSGATYLVQAMTILTFIVSSYLVVLLYPTPIALSDKMRKD